MKTYKIRTQKDGRGSVVEGTLPELQRYFSYTLEAGYSWNNKIKRHPKTFKSFVKNLQLAYSEKEANCYERTIVEVL